MCVQIVRNKDDDNKLINFTQTNNPEILEKFMKRHTLILDSTSMSQGYIYLSTYTYECTMYNKVGFDVVSLSGCSWYV